jgi:hypothetical protein
MIKTTGVITPLLRDAFTNDNGVKIDIFVEDTEVEKERLKSVAGDNGPAINRNCFWLLG